MKIYTNVCLSHNRLVVGTVLVSDQDKVYMMCGNQLQTTDKDQAHIQGIRRALCFVKCNKPLYANHDVIIYPMNNSKPYDSEILMEKIENDEYIQQFLKDKDIKLFKNELEYNDFDNNNVMITQHQVIYVDFNKFVRGREY